MLKIQLLYLTYEELTHYMYHSIGYIHHKIWLYLTYEE